MVNEIKNENVPDRKLECFIAWIWGVLLVGEWILSFFFIGSRMNQFIHWLGWGIFLLAFILVFMPIIIFPKKGNVPKGKNFTETTTLVDTGIYSIVRHPQYLGGGLFNLAFILISQHWVLALLGIPGMVIGYLSTIQEDKFLVKKFGQEYEKYKQKVPRWNLLWGLVKLLIRKIKQE